MLSNGCDHESTLCKMFSSSSSTHSSAPQTHFPRVPQHSPRIDEPEPEPEPEPESGPVVGISWLMLASHAPPHILSPPLPETRQHPGAQDHGDSPAPFIPTNPHGLKLIETQVAEEQCKRIFLAPGAMVSCKRRVFREWKRTSWSGVELNRVETELGDSLDLDDSERTETDDEEIDRRRRRHLEPTNNNNAHSTPPVCSRETI